jgi:hypothetical protein
MSALSIQVPFPVFQDRDGQPLENGYVWLGVANLNPQTNPVIAYFDKALTIPAAQPLRTLNGYISNAGTPAHVYVDGVNFSILVQDSKGSMVYNFQDGSGISPDASGIVYTPPFAGSTSTTVATKLSEWVSPEDFGAVADGVTNDYQAIQDAIDYLESIGGGTVICKNGGIYATNPAPALKNNVVVDMRGATWNMTLGSGNVPGVRIGTNSGIQNGELNAISTGTPSSQGFWHAAISMGEPNNSGDTPSNPGYYQFANNWFVRNMTLSTTRQNNPAFQGIGGFNNGILENIVIPDSATCSGIHFDWGNVGTVSGGDIPATRVAYDAGLCFTTHPNNIIIRNLKVGDLTSPLAAPDIGTRAVRLSACYGITIQNVQVAGTTYAAFNHVGGDLGFEFAQPDVRFFACRGTSVRNFQAKDSALFGASIDTYADNIAAAVALGYLPLFNTIMQGDITLEQFTTAGLGTNTNQDGIRLGFVNGVYIKDANCFNHNYGMFIDQNSQNIKVEKGNYYFNQRDGIAVRDDADTRYINFDSVVAQRNGVFAGASSPSGIKVSGGRSINIQNCFIGSTAEDFQDFGILIASPAANIKIINNTVLEVVAGGTAFVLTADGNYSSIDIFNGNVYNGSLGVAYGGQQIYPIAREYDPISQTFVGVWYASKAFLSGETTPPNGTWRTGDRILYSGGTVAAGFTGTICITGGSPGTWKRFGVAEA